MNEHNYYALGSLEGLYEHGSVFVQQTGQRVPCSFASEIGEPALPNRRYVLSGRISYSVAHRPLGIAVSHPVRLLKLDEELPTTFDLAGSDPLLTDGMPTEDFIRMMRGD